MNIFHLYPSPQDKFMKQKLFADPSVVQSRRRQLLSRFGWFAQVHVCEGQRKGDCLRVSWASNFTANDTRGYVKKVLLQSRDARWKRAERFLQVFHSQCDKGKTDHHWTSFRGRSCHWWVILGNPWHTYNFVHLQALTDSLGRCDLRILNLQMKFRLNSIRSFDKDVWKKQS